MTRLPWNRHPTRLPRRTRFRLSVHYLLAYPWHRLRCGKYRATPATRFRALWLPGASWHREVAAAELLALTVDTNRRVRSRAAATFPPLDPAADPLRLSQGLPPGSAAELAELLDRRPLYLGADGILPLAWRLWLVHGHEGLWTQLLRHGEPVAVEPLHTIGAIALGRLPTGELRAAATDPAVPRRARTKAAERLADAVAADPLAAAPFHILAGAMTEYRRVDPDGSVLAAAYLAMTAADRSRLRAALTELGEFDLLRKLRGATRTRPAVAEAGREPRFADLLSGSCLEAVAEAPTLRDRRPSQTTERELLDRLLRADPDRLRLARAQLTGDGHLPVPLPDAVVGVTAASFCPSGDRFAVAVAVTKGGARWHWSFRVYDSTTLEPLSEEPADDANHLESLVYTGSGFAGRYSESPGDGLPQRWVRFTRNGRVRVLAGRGWPLLARLRDGFVLVGDGGRLSVFTASGKPVPNPALPNRPEGSVWHLDGDPETGDLATVGDAGIRVYGTRPRRELADAEHREAKVRFLDRETLVSVRALAPGRLAVSRWGLADDSARTVEHELGGHAVRLGAQAMPYRLAAGTRILLVVPGQGEGQPRHDTLITLDATTLERLHTPPHLGWHILAAAPDSRGFLGVDESGHVPLLSLRALAPHPVAALVDTPLTELTPADLAVVERELPRATPSTRPVLDLLYHCLRYRFRDEIALGDPVGGTDYDIHLGGDR